LTRSLGESLRKAIVAGMAHRAGRPVALCMSADPDVVAAFEAEGLMIFEEPTRAVAALGALAEIGARRRKAPAQSAAAPSPALAALDPAAALSEHAAKKVLAAAGVPVLPERLAHDAGEAVQAARALGFPVAMKIVSPDIRHKTEVGGVMLGLADEAAVAAAHAAMLHRVRQIAPHAAIEGVLISPMARKGVETIIGVLRDPTFGPVVMFGLGGIFVEVMRDVTFRRAPFDEAEALRMIREVKGHALLDGARGAARADMRALAATLAAVSRFAATHAAVLEGVDINPFVVWEEGQGGAALDALIVTRPSRGD
jgi:acyl-CoA synthetase (NDP forming)